MQNDLLPVATVNAVQLHAAGETLSGEELRQRACTELLRQAAIDNGLLDAADPVSGDGTTSVAATQAIDALLDRELQIPEPTEEACRRFHAAHRSRYTIGERVHARHVLFAVTPGVEVAALRKRAESCLLDLRCADTKTDDRFSRVAGELSNCPSSRNGGDLGWLSADECAPEFARELFGQKEIGVLPRLVNSRFGFHVVEVLAREPGEEPDFEVLRAAVAQALRQQAFATAVRQYVSVLAGSANIEGVVLDGSATPLVQ
jgi:peptidyl-prolyl cis-trans isomerase C